MFLNIESPVSANIFRLEINRVLSIYTFEIRNPNILFNYLVYLIYLVALIIMYYYRVYIFINIYKLSNKTRRTYYKI